MGAQLLRDLPVRTFPFLPSSGPILNPSRTTYSSFYLRYSSLHPPSVKRSFPFHTTPSQQPRVPQQLSLSVCSVLYLKPMKNFSLAPLALPAHALLWDGQRLCSCCLLFKPLSSESLPMGFCLEDIRSIWNCLHSASTNGGKKTKALCVDRFWFLKITVSVYFSLLSIYFVNGEKCTWLEIFESGNKALKINYFRSAHFSLNTQAF